MDCNQGISKTLASSSARRIAAPKPQTSREVIQANVSLLIEQLEAGHSEGLTAYLTAMGRFHNYSFGNILEIAQQRPDATRVAGLYAWNQLGRKVMKGQRGIYLRRSGESCYTLLDDLTAATLPRLAVEGYAPAAVVEPSPGSFQAWLGHTQPFPKRAWNPGR